MANLRRINQEDLRNHNLSVTLDTLLRAQKPMSRADLAKETGLTKATLSLLASMLIESGVVQEGEPVVSTTYGRPSTPLEIRGGSIAGIGLQINTDGYGCLALDLNGDTLGREWVSEDMTGTDPYEIFAKLDAMTFPLESRLKRRGCKVVGAGFALPGIVTGIVLSAGRVFGEAAALIFTAGSAPARLNFGSLNLLSPTNPFNIFRPACSLAVYIWRLTSEPTEGSTEIVWGTATVLLVCVLLFNVLARLLGKFLSRRLTAE